MWRCRPIGAKTPAEIAPQVIELASLFHDTIFVMGPISLTGAALSKRIYKICTPVSTGFVDNVRGARVRAPRKTLPGAAFHRVGRAP